jgi:large subunit ribosomal protein L10
MAVSKQQKAAALTALQEKMGKMKALVFTHYQGLSVKEVTDLRCQLREQDVELVVAKKTLLRRALKDAKLDPASVDQLDGSVALAFGYTDEIAPAKILQLYAKTHPSVELLGAIVDGQMMDKAQAVALAKLPGRQELRAKLVWVIGSPISGLVNVTAGTLRSLINVLNSIKEKSPANAG